MPGRSGPGPIPRAEGPRAPRQRLLRSPCQATWAVVACPTQQHSQLRLCGQLETSLQDRCLASLGPGARWDALFWAAHPVRPGWLAFGLQRVVGDHRTAAVVGVACDPLEYVTEGAVAIDEVVSADDRETIEAWPGESDVGRDRAVRGMEVYEPRTDTCRSALAATSCSSLR